MQPQRRPRRRGASPCFPGAARPRRPQYEWLGDGPHVLVGLLLAAQAGWEPLSREDAARVAAAWGPADGPPAPEAVKILADAGASAALVCAAEEQAGSLRIQGDLYRDIPGGSAPLRFSYAGKTSQVTTIAMLLAEVAGEALEQRFPRALRPPLPSPPDFLLSRLEPSFGPRNPLENLAQTEAFMLTALKIDPNNADAYFQLGSLYARNNLLEKALAHLTSAVELSPKSARYHWGLGVAFPSRGSWRRRSPSFCNPRSSTRASSRASSPSPPCTAGSATPRRARRRSSAPRRPSPRTPSCSPRSG